MATANVSFHDVQQSIISLVGLKQLNNLEDGQIITIPKTNKKYKLCVDSQQRVVVQRSSEFLHQKVSSFKQIRRTFSDAFGFSTKSRLEKILNDKLTQQVFNWLQLYNVSADQSESIGVSIKDFHGTETTRDTYPLLNSGSYTRSVEFNDSVRMENELTTNRKIRFASKAQVRDYEPVDESVDEPAVNSIKYNNAQAGRDLATIFKSRNRGVTPRCIVGPIDIA